MTMAIPRKEGHILLDMAMSQYSNGKLEVLQARGETLPIAGGFDTEGNLTCDPGAHPRLTTRPSNRLLERIGTRDRTRHISRAIIRRSNNARHRRRAGR